MIGLFVSGNWAVPMAVPRCLSVCGVHVRAQGATRCHVSVKLLHVGHGTGNGRKVSEEQPVSEGA